MTDRAERIDSEAVAAMKGLFALTENRYLEIAKDFERMSGGHVWTADQVAALPGGGAMAERLRKHAVELTDKAAIYRQMAATTRTILISFQLTKSV